MQPIVRHVMSSLTSICIMSGCSLRIPVFVQFAQLALSAGPPSMIVPAQIAGRYVLEVLCVASPPPLPSCQVGGPCTLPPCFFIQCICRQSFVKRETKHLIWPSFYNCPGGPQVCLGFTGKYNLCSISILAIFLHYKVIV